MKIFIGWDSREIEAYKVCVLSLIKHSSISLDITPLKREELRTKGVYKREEECASTEFAFTRFLVPWLSDYSGWALFVDCDFLFTKDVAKLYSRRKDKYAIMCVQHNYTPRNTIKMDGQKQLAYPRKNWSSCILWNCGHQANRTLTREVVSTASGACLHRFEWLKNREIGRLPVEWNWLEGEYEKPKKSPAAIHYTNGGPWFENCQNVDYADLWKNLQKNVIAYETAVSGAEAVNPKSSNSILVTGKNL